MLRYRMAAQVVWSRYKTSSGARPKVSDFGVSCLLSRNKPATPVQPDVLDLDRATAKHLRNNGCLLSSRHALPALSLRSSDLDICAYIRVVDDLFHSENCPGSALIEPRDCTYRQESGPGDVSPLAGFIDP